MKITFISNYLTHHQIPFSDEMYALLGNNYTFVATQTMDEERKSMGWSIHNQYPYELLSYQNEECLHKTIQLANTSDVVLISSAPDRFIIDRLKNNKLTFKISERLYKKGLSISNLPRVIISSFIHHGRFQHKPLYMLCASAYTASDLSVSGNYKNKTFKWGYFPKTLQYDIQNLMEKKGMDDTVTLLWVGRLIDFKHPEDAFLIAKKLKEDGYNFILNIIGTGELESDLKDILMNDDLNDKVKFLGPMTPEQVRKYMKKANIYLLTSDFNEGWGAVLNEAMNSGCAVVASHAAGSVPFLINNDENGLIYKYGDLSDFYYNVKKVVNDKLLRRKLGINAYQTINNTWNAKIAARRLLGLINEILEKGTCELFTSGPCSKAEIIKNNWIYKYK